MYQLQNGTHVGTRPLYCPGPRPAPVQSCEGQDCLSVWEASEWSQVGAGAAAGAEATARGLWASSAGTDSEVLITELMEACTSLSTRGHGRAQPGERSAHPSLQLLVYLYSVQTGKPFRGPGERGSC